jgi:two-component system, OmpR family, sensor histidine kinase KdpD
MPDAPNRRPTPDEILQRVEAEEHYYRRGRLKVFLGYASGVGKTFRMLDEGRRRKMRGEDVVVASIQPDPSAQVQDLLDSFEVIPHATNLGSPAIDVPAVLRRLPGVCLIDGLAYDNPPGSAHPQRWQDVEDLLAAGISVITSINLQFVAERQKQVERVRGKAVAESVPESFLRTADDIEIVDAPPEYCVVRAAQGLEGEAGDPVQLERQLSELREIALVLAAEVVDHQLEDYLRRHGIALVYGTHERILVCVTPRSNASLMIRRGRRQADRFHGDLHVVYVEQDSLSEADQRVLEANLECARETGAHVEVLHVDDPIDAILEYARRQGITQIFVGHSQRSGWTERWKANPVEQLIMGADGIDVRIFPHDGPHDKSNSGQGA